ncbi:MAG: AsmA family protein [Pseudomonadota bacterium]
MKRILTLFGAVLAILIVAAVTVPFLIPSEVYKAQIESAATKALGRDVTLIGDARLSVLPTLSARVDGVEVANPDGFSDPLMIEAGQLRASVKLLPLISRRVEIAQITLTDPTVRLERLADGRANWELGNTTDPAPAEPPADGGGGFETGIDRAALANAAVYYRDATTETEFALTEFTATARVSALDQPLSSTGSGYFNGQPFDYRVRLDTLAGLNAAEPVTLAADLGTIFGDVSYDGALTLADIVSMDGTFEIASDTLGQVLPFLGSDDWPILVGNLQSLRAQGTIGGDLETANIDFSKLTLAATGLDLDYAGQITLGAVPSLNGQVELNAADAQRLLKPGHALIPLLTMLGNVDFVASVSGPVSTPSLTGITLKQRGQDLVTDYSGMFSLAGEQSLDGMLELSSDNPRAVLSALGTEMPAGQSLNALAISGQTTGTLLAPTLDQASITLDDTTASGKVGANLSGTRPRIVANLAMDRLDLTPFLGSGSQQSDPEPSLNEDWDDTPLDLAALNLLNATVTVAANEVVMDQIVLNDALLNTRLDDGRLSAIFRQDDDTPGFKVFQGNWYGDLVLDASRSTPSLTIEALADSIAAQDMLTALTGFQNLSGIGDVHLDLRSEGSSLKSLIAGLDGKFESDLNQGALKGMNLAKLVRDASNIRDLVASGNLSIASFRDALSPEAETDFSKFIGNLDFNNGVASITNLSIDNPVVGITGAGSIDLGARTLDIRLTPRVDVAATGAGSTLGLGNIPIPLRVYGSWSQVRYGIDSSAVQAELTARLRDQAAGEIADRIGGDAGAIIGGIIGGQSSTSETNDEETAPDLEDELRDRALGALFGNRNRDPDPEEAPESD